MIWVRIGDGGSYESFGDLQEVIDLLNEIGAGRFLSWVDGGIGVGIETENYGGHDFISLYHGDELADLRSHLLPDERAFVEDRLHVASCR
jgi:hypothetical protein